MQSTPDSALSAKTRNLTMTKPAVITEDPSSVIDRIEALTRKSGAHFNIMAIPTEALPAGLAVKKPMVGISVDGSGNVVLHDLSRHVEALAGKPVRRKGTAIAQTLDSFIDLVNRHKSANTVIFADASWRAPKFTAVIDYHAEARGTAGEAGEDSLARFGQHRVSYTFPLSEPWKVWIANNGKAMAQADFAAFIEDHIVDLASPDQSEVNEARDRFQTTVATPAGLMELSRGMEITVGSKVKSRQNLSSGEKQLVFETEHRSADGGTLIVPGLFVVNVPPFYQGETMRILARLRYRPSAEGVVWFYELYRPDLAIEERVTNDLATAGSECEVPTFHGHPET
jgi:uncharacterized protein YfdQ (DUF2303 family)